MNRLVAVSLLFALVAVFFGTPTPSVAASKGVLAEDPTGDQTTWSLGRLVLRRLKGKKGMKTKAPKSTKAPKKTKSPKSTNGLKSTKAPKKSKKSKKKRRRN